MSAEARRIETPSVNMTYTYVSELDARFFVEKAQTKIRLIEKYLDKKIDRPIEIFDRTETPQRSQTYMIPTEDGYRFRIGIHFARVAKRTTETTLVHELTHAIAGRPAGNSLLLAEGLAVHVHGLLSDVTERMSYSGFDIDQAAKRDFAKPELAMDLARLHRGKDIFQNYENRARDANARRRAAYIYAGSFVKFLVDRAGIAKFMDLYRTGDFKRIYGAGLAALQHEWRAKLVALPKRL